MGSVPRLTERTRDARRRQILDAARQCLSRNGFQSTSMQDIFEEAGLSAGAVYSHFTGKDEIVYAIADEVIEALTAPLYTADAHGEALSLGDLLGHVFSTLQRAEITTIAITFWAEAIRNPGLRRRLSRRYRRVQHDLTRLVRTQQQRGGIDPEIPAPRVARVLTSLGPAFLHLCAFDNTVTAETFTEGVKALLRQP